MDSLIKDSNKPLNICPYCYLKVGVLVTTIFIIVKITIKVTTCSDANKMVLTVTIAE